MQIRKEITPDLGSENLRQQYEMFFSNSNLNSKQIEELLSLIKESLNQKYKVKGFWNNIINKIK